MNIEQLIQSERIKTESFKATLSSNCTCGTYVDLDKTAEIAIEPVVSLRDNNYFAN